MARFDRDQTNPTQHAAAKPVRSISPYGRGARSAWSALALTLLLTTVSLLAHDSTQQTVAPASVIPSVQPSPIETSSAATSPKAMVTFGTHPDADTEAVAMEPVPVATHAPDATSTPSPVATADAAAVTVLPVGAAAVVPVVSPTAAPTPTRQGSTGSGYQISPSALSTTPIALTAAAATVQLAAHPRLILDANTLASLRQNVTANTPEWQALKATCDPTSAAR